MTLQAFLILAGALSAVGLAVLFLFHRPKATFLVIAAIAPLSTVGSFGPIKPVHLLGSLAIIAALNWWLLRGRARLPPVVIVHASIACLFGGWAALLSLSQSGELHPFLSFLGAILLIVTVFVVYDNVNDIERWLWVFAMAVLAMTLASFALVLVAPPTRSLLLSASSTGFRLQGTFGNPNFFGGVQILAFAIFLWAAVTGKRSRPVAVLGVGISVFALLLSQSRSAAVGCLAGLLLAALVWTRYSNRPVRNAVGTLALAATLVTVYINLPSEIAGFRLQRLDPTASSTTLYSVTAEDVESARLDVYLAHLRTLQAHPWGLGYGGEQKEVTGSLSGIYMMPHNFIIKEMLNYGVLGGAYMAAMWWTPAALALIWGWRRRSPPGGLSPYLLLAISGYLIHALFHSMTNWIVLYIMWGICLRAIQLERWESLRRLSAR